MGIEPVGKWVIDHPVCHPQQCRTVHILKPVKFERAQIIGVAELAGERFEDRPVPVASRCAIRLLQMFTQISLDAIIVEESVVDVEQEDNAVWFGHRKISLLNGKPIPPAYRFMSPRQNRSR